MDGKSCNLEITPEGDILPSEDFAFAEGRSIYTEPGPEWQPLFEGLIKWLRKTSKDWIHSAREIRELYPLERRTGVLPITIDDAEGIRKRLLGLDNIGIIPEYQFPHRANRHFDRKQDVYEVMHYSDLGRYKRRLTPFIAWEPLPLLVPREINPC